MSDARRAKGAMQAVVGYMPDAVAKELHAGRGLGREQLEVPLDPGKSAAMLRINAKDIEEVRLGPSRDGHTGVQLVLKPDSQFEVVAKAALDIDALTMINDPGLASVLGRLQWFVIYAGPVFRQNATGQLVAASSNL
jgi:hypothetical protein